MNIDDVWSEKRRLAMHNTMYKLQYLVFGLPLDENKQQLTTDGSISTLQTQSRPPPDSDLNSVNLGRPGGNLQRHLYNTRPATPASSAPARDVLRPLTADWWDSWAAAAATGSGTVSSAGWETPASRVSAQMGPSPARRDGLVSLTLVPPELPGMSARVSIRSVNDD